MRHMHHAALCAPMEPSRLPRNFDEGVTRLEFMTEAQRLREEAERCMRLAEAVADERAAHALVTWLQSI
jgi:hypothetical protein